MNINEDEARLALAAIQQCQDINGFIDEEEKNLRDRIKDEYPSLKYFHWNSQN